MVETPEVTPIESSLDVYSSNLSDILGYLTENETQHQKWQTILEDVYNHLSLISSNDSKLKQKILLPQLLVKNFDDEQIWQQIELLNSVIIGHVGDEINKKLTQKSSIVTKPAAAKPDEPENEASNDSVLEDEEDIMEEDIGDEEGAPSKPSKSKAPVFNLKDMDKFCEELEKEDDEVADSDKESEADIFGLDDNAEEDEEEDEEEEESKLEKELKKVGKMQILLKFINFRTDSMANLHPVRHLR